jgi:hypothetical protein
MKLERFVIYDADGTVTGTCTNTRAGAIASTPPGGGAIRSDKNPATVRAAQGRLRPRGKVQMQVEKDAVAWGKLRSERNARLAQCDWTQTLDQSETFRAAWAAYRAALRGLPITTQNPHNFSWPKRPMPEENNP